MSFSDLSVENYFGILEYLPQRYYKNIALVNKYFYSIFLNRPVITDVITDISIEEIVKNDMVEDLKLKLKLLEPLKDNLTIAEDTELKIFKPISTYLYELSNIISLSIKYSNVTLINDVFFIEKVNRIPMNIKRLCGLIMEHLAKENYEIIIFILDLNKSKKLTFNKRNILLPIKNNCKIEIYNEYFRKYFLYN